MKTDIIVLILVVAIVAFMFLFPFAKKTSEVLVGGVKVKAEIADNPLTQTKGLMFHKPLAEDEGMLFKFRHENYYAFWMINVSFPIDMIWIDSGKEIVYVVEHAEPCFLACKAYVPTAKAKYVLEVKAGFVKEHKVKVGDAVKF